MLAVLGLALFALAQLAALAMIPLGLPGTWLQIAAAAGLAVASGGARLGWGWVAGFTVLALAGELVEFLAGRWGATRFGGSHAAGWGALAGGLVGAIVGGVPIPIVGSVVASFIGTFVGAIAGELWARRAALPDLRVGLGALVGRAVGVATKLAVAFVIAIASLALVLADAVGGG